MKGDKVIALAIKILEQRMRTGAALTSPAAVRDYLRLILHAKPHEVFVCIWLDLHQRVIAVEELFRGTLGETAVYPREVVKAALQHNAAFVIFAHNHPSGLPVFSKTDEVLTWTLMDALHPIDTKVLDHFIVGGAEAISFTERGLL